MHRREDISAVIPMAEQGQGQLNAQLNNLRAAVKAQVCRYTIEHTLAFLEEYAAIHFCEEERYMQYFGYPDYLLHKEMHDQFAADLQFLKDDLRNMRALGLRGSYELSVETIQVVADWLAGHVAKEDKRLDEFLLTRSVRGDGPDLSCCAPRDRAEGDAATICSVCKKI